MNEQPDIPVASISDTLRTEFGLADLRVRFLPLGFDNATAVYDVQSEREHWFLKIRFGPPREYSAWIPSMLASMGCPAVIAPTPTATGKLSFPIGSHWATVARFVPGANAYQRRITKRLWTGLAKTLRHLHSLGDEICSRFNVPVWGFDHEVVRATRREMTRLDEHIPHDSLSDTASRFLPETRRRTIELADVCDHIAAGRTELDPRTFVVCHSDLHAGNIHIGDDGELYIVDWDEVVVAPPERDLMYFGAGLLATGLDPAEETALFYEEYQNKQGDPELLRYFRVVRILADIVVFCKTLLRGTSNNKDREASLEYLKSNFEPGGTIDVALGAQN